MNDMRVYQDGTYLENNPTWHEEDSYWKANHIRKILTANKIEPSTIGEVGCGAGGILVSLSKNYGEKVEFRGYEISPQAFEISKKKETKNIKFFLQDIIDQEDVFLDVILLIDIFEHVEDYMGFIRNLKKRGKYTVFHIPLDLSAQTVLRNSPILTARQKVGHLHYFTKDTALATLRDTGYEVVDWFYTGSSLDLPNRGFGSKLLKLPRKLFYSLNRDLAVRILGGYSLMVLTK